MKKFIKTGLSAVAAFAFMFATSVTVVAQENPEFSSGKYPTSNTSKDVKVITSMAPSTSPILLTHTWTYQLSSPGGETTAANYSFGGSPTCSPGDQTVCQIEAPEDLTLPPGSPRQPKMDAFVGSTGQTVGQRIAEALSDKEPNETAISLKAP